MERQILQIKPNQWFLRKLASQMDMVTSMMGKVEQAIGAMEDSAKHKLK